MVSLNWLSRALVITDKEWSGDDIVVSRSSRSLGIIAKFSSSIGSYLSHSSDLQHAEPAIVQIFERKTVALHVFNQLFWGRKALWTRRGSSSRVQGS